MRHMLQRIAATLGLALLVPCAGAAVVLSASSNPVPPSGSVAVEIAFVDASDAPTVLILEFAFNPALCTPFGADFATESAGKAIDWNVVDSTLYVVAYSLDAAFGPSDTLRIFARIAAAAPTGNFFVAQGGGSATNEVLEDLPLSFSGFTVNVQPTNGYHDADTNTDWAISLSELLRVIQFYNSDGLHCQVGTEDGFGVGPGDTSCAPHDSDYAPQNWDLSLSELLRLIQIYNLALGSYHPDASGEDGFSPLPF